MKIFLSRGNFFGKIFPLVKRENLQRLQNCHHYGASFMSTQVSEKVQIPTLWKNLWKVWKSQGLQGEFPTTVLFSPRKLPTKFRTFWGIFPQTRELCCKGNPWVFPDNSINLFPFSMGIPQKMTYLSKVAEKFLVKFHKSSFV